VCVALCLKNKKCENEQSVRAIFTPKVAMWGMMPWASHKVDKAAADCNEYAKSSESPQRPGAASSPSRTGMLSGLLAKLDTAVQRTVASPELVPDESVSSASMTLAQISLFSGTAAGAPGGVESDSVNSQEPLITPVARTPEIGLWCGDDQKLGGIGGSMLQERGADFSAASSGGATASKMRHNCLPASRIELQKHESKPTTGQLVHPMPPTVVKHRVKQMSSSLSEEIENDSADGGDLENVEKIDNDTVEEVSLWRRGEFDQHAVQAPKTANKLLNPWMVQNSFALNKARRLAYSFTPSALDDNNNHSSNDIEAIKTMEGAVSEFVSEGEDGNVQSSLRTHKAANFTLSRLQGSFLLQKRRQSLHAEQYAQAIEPKVHLVANLKIDDEHPTYSSKEIVSAQVPVPAAALSADHVDTAAAVDAADAEPQNSKQASNQNGLRPKDIQDSLHLTQKHQALYLPLSHDREVEREDKIGLRMKIHQEEEEQFSRSTSTHEEQEVNRGCLTEGTLRQKQDKLLETKNWEELEQLLLLLEKQQNIESFVKRQESCKEAEMQQQEQMRMHENEEAQKHPVFLKEAEIQLETKKMKENAEKAKECKRQREIGEQKELEQEVLGEITRIKRLETKEFTTPINILERQEELKNQIKILETKVALEKLKSTLEDQIRRQQQHMMHLTRSRFQTWAPASRSQSGSSAGRQSRSSLRSDPIPRSRSTEESRHNGSQGPSREVRRAQKDFYKQEPGKQETAVKKRINEWRTISQTQSPQKMDEESPVSRTFEKYFYRGAFGASEKGIA